MTLNPDELRALTGRAKRPDQRTWLEERGIPYRQDGERLLVSKTVVDRWLGGAEIPQARGFDLSQVR